MIGVGDCYTQKYADSLPTREGVYQVYKGSMIRDGIVRVVKIDGKLYSKLTTIPSLNQMRWMHDEGRLVENEDISGFTEWIWIGDLPSPD